MNLFRRHVDEHDLKLRVVAEEIGINHATIYALYNGRRQNWMVTTLQKVAAYLGVTLDELAESMEGEIEGGKAKGIEEPDEERHPWPIGRGAASAD